jgi:hypothetical protein
MGSYAGSSDWDDVPTRQSVSTFKPRPAAKTPAPADPPREAPEAELTATRAERRRLNAIFAFDTTGSMTPWIENVQEKMEYLAGGLVKLMDMEITFVGVGDHCDGRNMLQLKPPSADVEVLKAAVHSLRPTDGGDTPEAFECLFKVLGAIDYDVPTVLVLITDSIPHGMEGYQGDDDGCPFNVDYREELDSLKGKLKNVYLVTCASDPQLLALQKKLVGQNALVQVADFRRLTNLLMAICMEEAGDLDYFMGLLERQRGPERRGEVLKLMGRS